MKRNETKITIIGNRNDARSHLTEVLRVLTEYDSEERAEGIEGMVYINPFHVYTLKGKLYLGTKS